MLQSAILVLALSSSFADAPPEGVSSQPPVAVATPASGAKPDASPAASDSAVKPNALPATPASDAKPDASPASDSAAGSSPQPKADNRVPVPKIVLTTAEEKEAYKAKYQKLARESFKTSKPDPGIVVPQLVNMFNELRMVEGLQKSELTRMRDTLRVRMIAMSDQLHRDIAKAKRLGKSPTERLHARVAAASRGVETPAYKKRDGLDALLEEPNRPNSAENSRVTQPESAASTESEANGKSEAASTTPEALAATEQQNVQSLINLIQDTIDPDSWESRGGGGSIYYYAPLHALVIRQTEDVHRQIGGVLGNLNR